MAYSPQGNLEALIRRLEMTLARQRRGVEETEAQLAAARSLLSVPVKPEKLRP